MSEIIISELFHALSFTVIFTLFSKIADSAHQHSGESAHRGVSMATEIQLTGKRMLRCV